MIHVDWEIVAAVGCFLVGLVILMAWIRKPHEADKIEEYSDLKFLICLLYKVKYNNIKWYEWGKMKRLNQWFEREMAKADQLSTIDERPKTNS